MVSSEDFSFPKITNPLPHFAISPSLWRVSSLVYPDYRDEDDERELDFAKKSFSSFTAGHEVKIESGEEKMDMLWENFNDEELQRVSSNSLGSKKQNSDHSLDSESARGEVKQLCCVKKDLKISKSDSNTMITAATQYKRQRIVLMFKDLKKIFLHRSSSSDPTKNHQKVSR